MGNTKDAAEGSAAPTGSLSSLDDLFPLATFDWSPEKYLIEKMTAEFCRPTFDYSAFDAHAQICEFCRDVKEEWCDVGVALWENMPRMK